MKDARRLQTRAAIAFVAIVAAIGAGFGACTSYQRPNGENCLKDADCLTNYCVAQVCSNPPNTLNGSSYEDGSVSEDSGGGGSPDTGTAATDSASPSKPDSSGDSATDGPPVATDAGHDSGPAIEDASDGASSADANDAESASDAGDAGDASEAEDADDAAMNDESDSETEDASPDGADAMYRCRPRRAERGRAVLTNRQEFPV
ncbi:MAG: hypothetical protein ACLQVI_22750 [Polyangiaceae bacterium]